ncbi:MAG: hypothetical protein WCK05_15815 [Planctomycetota bacterium]
MRSLERGKVSRAGRYARHVAAWWLPALLAGWMSVAPGQAATFTTTEGLSMEYPDGWSIDSNTDNTSGKAYDKVIETTAMMRTQNIQPERFATNVTVVVSRERMIASPANLIISKTRLPGLLAKEGMKISGLAGEMIDVAGRKGQSLTWEATANGMSFRQWQVQTSGNKKAYTFTFSAGASDFAAEEPVFRKILASIRVPGEPDTDSSGLTGVLWQPEVVAGIAGGLVGSAAAALWAVRRAGKKKTTPAGIENWQVNPTPPLPATASSPADPADETPITFSCVCGQKIKMLRSLSGKTGKCPKCQAIFQIP